MNERELKDLLRTWEETRQKNEEAAKKADTMALKHYYMGLRDAQMDCIYELTLAWAGAEK